MTFTMILEHMSLVVAALLFAILAGIPLGIICYFYPSTRKVILRVVDLIQTTPALALLGIIMVIMNPGKPTVIVGLALYSLLPIVRNTCLGLDQVPEHLIEAGKGMGMTRMYRLIHVEIPIAAPIIFTGIRIAAVNAIGTAVFASFVGGGGLGSVITTGIRQEDMTAILGGTGVLMAAALILDLLMGLAERYLNSRSSQRSKGSRYAARGAAVLSAAAAVVLCVYAFLPKSTEGLLLYEGDLFLCNLQVGGEILHQPTLNVLSADHFGLFAAEFLDTVIQVRAKVLKIVAFLDCGEASERGRILNNFLQWAGIISSTEGLGEAAGVVYFPGGGHGFESSSDMGKQICLEIHADAAVI